MSPALLFSTFEVTSQAFYRTALSAAIVNLKPIVPGRKRWASICGGQGILTMRHRCFGDSFKTSASIGRPQWYGSCERPRKLLTGCTDTELVALMRSVNRVGTIIERVYGADALTVACQVCSPIRS